jgi:hypothetical protein
VSEGLALRRNGLQRWAGAGCLIGQDPQATKNCKSLKYDKLFFAILSASKRFRTY